MNKYTVLFLSSSEISIPLLEKIASDERFEVLALICQADKPAGRSLLNRKAPTKIRAEELDIKVFQPLKLSSDEKLFKEIKAYNPDFILTFAYGQILSEEWLSLSKIASLNVHASLLPKYRGASPIQASLLNGDKETGISLIKMVKEMDKGPLASIHSIKIGDHITAGILHDELSELAAQKIPDDLILVAGNPGIFADQKHENASYCKKIIKKDGYIDFKEDALTILRKFRAYTPWPGVWTKYSGKRLKLVDIIFDQTALSPGEVRCAKHSVLIGTMDGSIKAKQLQLESKLCLHTDQFVIGHPEFCKTFLPS